MEEWKAIEDFQDYKVSSLGRVKSLKFGKEQILKPVLNSNGYLYINLCKDGIQKTVKVHRLVCQAFLPNPENKLEIDHINRNKQDNRLDNLRWATHSENRLNRDDPLGVSGERHISPHRNLFQVQITRQDFKVYKSFKTLEEAIAWRDQQLNLQLTTMNSSS
jgi:hypothetical protein